MDYHTGHVLEVAPLNGSSKVLDFYRSHGPSHPVDSGIDFFIPDGITIPGRSNVIIGLGISARAKDTTGDDVSWMLLPRSSISKTPLRLSNSLCLMDAGCTGEIKVCVDNISDAE